MLICGANDVIGVGQLVYTADSGAGTARHCSGTGTAGTGLQVLVLGVCRSGIVVCFGVHGCIISHMYTPHFMVAV